MFPVHLLDVCVFRSTVQSRKDEGILLWNNSLINTTTQKQVRKTYINGVISVPVDAFPTWALKVPKKVLDRTGKGEKGVDSTSTFLFLAI